MPDKNKDMDKKTQPKESYSKEELREIITSIKRKNEQEFQEQLKKMTPKEREEAIEFANDLL